MNNPRQIRRPMTPSPPLSFAGTNGTPRGTTLINGRRSSVAQTVRYRRDRLAPELRKDVLEDRLAAVLAGVELGPSSSDMAWREELTIAELRITWSCYQGSRKHTLRTLVVGISMRMLRHWCGWHRSSSSSTIGWIGSGRRLLWHIALRSLKQCNQCSAADGKERI
jgi:hypothetical protein